MAILTALAPLLLLFASAVNAVVIGGKLTANVGIRPGVPKVTSTVSGPITSRNGTTLPPYDTIYYFDQLIDHNNPDLGTFSQRYWFTYEFYEAGGPIILFTPGEVNADGYSGYLTNETMNGMIAEQESGAAIVLEHRFYGLSNPYDDLSVQSLQLHTIQQAIDDLVYFANTVVLPMPGGDAVGPTQAPWVLIGGSYSGALTGWTVTNQPNVFRAAYASSAVVESIVYYWGYFEPIRQYMPQNCSSDVEAVISYLDGVFTIGTPEEQDAMKTLFGMNLSHADDFTGALRYPLWDWQSLQPYVGYAQFFEFCDALEVKDGVSAPATGWGLEHALNAWGTYWTNVYYPMVCGDYDAETCLGSYDPTQSYYTDISVDNSGRSWEWIVCNYVGFLQDGAPLYWPSLVSRLIQPSYDERQCTYYFPEQFKTPTAPNVDETNSAYHGWFMQNNRLVFANGKRDPWREATLSADGTNFQSTPEQPILLGDGFHCSDLLANSGEVDPTIATVQSQVLSYMKEWIAGFEPASS